MKGIIFDLQRCSYVDGPGIRTTVFFKGCNLKCKWCHNPEGQSLKPQILLYSDKCIKCGACTEACENPDGCILCGKCALYCPVNAKILCGNEYNVKELMKEILKDTQYYGSSGGVTFSGGECMLQIDFLTKLLTECKNHGINTAIDTAGYVPYEYFERILPYTDIFLYDVKCMNNLLHKKYTGVDNGLILNNLKKLLKTNKRIFVRIPVISGINDSIEEITEIKKFFEENGYPEKIELLPYHGLGEHKFQALGKEFKPFKTPSKEKIIELYKILN